jgi:hypothetical protein
MDDGVVLDRLWHLLGPPVEPHVTLSHLDIRADHMAQAQAGHANAKTTDTYRKPTIDHRKEHARRMTGVLYEVGGQASSAKKVPK